MIHYHGLPITPDVAAVAVLTGRHGLVSYAYPSQIGLAMEVCQSVVIDNGAFTFWKTGRVPDWEGYYRFVEDWSHHPAFDWALIPDVIDGDEEVNDRLVEQWPHDRALGVPVWHLHESTNRLVRLALAWPRVALGSSGQYASVGNAAWWSRMGEAMGAVCDYDGQPVTKLHGLRMLNPKVFSRLPLSSADSSNIARNIGLDVHWKTGRYPPPTKAARGVVMAMRIEHTQSAARWERKTASDVQ